jgi:Tfp pilus assembly protein PilV
MPLGHRLLMRRNLRRITGRLRHEAGFGLLELLIALTIVTVGIGALLSVFASSIVSLEHSNTEGTAVTLADRQLERYRSMPFNCVPTGFPFTPPDTCGTYTDFPNPYLPSQTTTPSDSPDQRIYTVTTSVTPPATSQCVVSTSSSPLATREIKVTVALQSGPTLGPVLAQETSCFSADGTTS